MRGAIHRKGSDTMDHDYLDIDALIRDANQQRSVAMGKLASSAWSACKQAFAGLQYPRVSKNTVVANPSTFIALQQLP